MSGRLAISPGELSTETFGLEDYLDDETIAHLRRVFVSRSFDDNFISSIGIRHTKGILLNNMGSAIPPVEVAKRICLKLFKREPKHYNLAKELEKKKKWTLDEDTISFMEELEKLICPNEEEPFPLVLLEHMDLLSGEEAIFLRHCLDSPTDMLIFATVDNLKKDLIDPALLRQSRFEVEIKLRKRTTPAEAAEEYLSTHYTKQPEQFILEPICSDKTDSLC